MTGVASTGKTGIGVLLQVSDGASPPVWATVANVTTMTVGGITINMVDATHLNSPNFYQEFKPGLKSSEDWTFTVQWDPTNPTQSGTTGMKKFAEDRSLETWRVNAGALGITEGIECDAYVSNLGGIQVQPDGLMTRQVTLKVSGAVRSVTLP